MRKQLPIFYSALLLTGVNLFLRFVSTSFQVHISGRIGAEGVGLLQLVLSVGGLAMTAGMGGIRTATMYLTAAEIGRKKYHHISWVLRGCFLYSILCSGCIAVCVYAAAPYLAQHWVGNIHTASAIRAFAVFLPIVCLTGCMTGYFTAANRITTLAGIEIAEQLCYMVITMTALQVWAGNDPEKACRAVVLGSGLSSCLTLVWLLGLRLREKSPRGERIPVAGKLLRTAVPLAFADDIKAGISTTENLMVPKRLALHRGEMSALASFGTVVGMVFPVLMFPAAILYALAELLIPELARCQATQNNYRIRYLIRKGLRVALLYGCISGGILFLIADALCDALYNSSTAGGFLKLYSFLAPMLYCDAITDAMIKGLGQQTASVRYNILTSAMDVLLLFFLLPKYGMTGYFFSFLITHLINFVLSLRRLLNISGVTIPFYQPALTCCATISAAYLAQLSPSTLHSVVIFALLLPALLSLFGVIGKQDILWLKCLIIKK